MLKFKLLITYTHLQVVVTLANGTNIMYGFNKKMYFGFITTCLVNLCRIFIIQLVVINEKLITKTV